MTVGRVLDLAIWPSIENRIAAACAGSLTMSADTVHADLIDGRKQLWVVVSGKGLEAVVVTELTEHGKCRAASICICTGDDRARWIDKGLAVIGQWAKEQGCAAFSLVARPGWRRELAKRGFRHTHDLLEMGL